MSFACRDFPQLSKKLRSAVGVDEIGDVAGEVEALLVLAQIILDRLR